MPRRSAVSMITFGPSTWQVMTSMPWSARLLVASASFTGIDQSPVKITVVVMDGSTERAPSAKLLTLISTCGIGLAAMKPSFLLLRRMTRGDAVEVLAHADIAEIGSGVHRVLVLSHSPPQWRNWIFGYLVAMRSMYGSK